MAAGGKRGRARPSANEKAVLRHRAPHLVRHGWRPFRVSSTILMPLSPAALNVSGRAGTNADPAPLRERGLKGHAVSGRHRGGDGAGLRRRLVAPHVRYGRLPLADVFAPAIAYAE